MPVPKKKSAQHVREDSARVIAQYEAMSSEEIEAELRAQNIDPRPTIAAVTSLVRERLAQWRAPGAMPAMKKRR
ncbi:MAG TPA: hypothetical protein VEK57_04505 [Thermoanaerobaculia bacterium]|jgi:hypothetical protein|nr:hypothetical protein [Thermoanaerobaculia bacterium]